MLYTFSGLIRGEPPAPEQADTVLEVWKVWVGVTVAPTHSTWRLSFQLTSSSYCSSNSQHMETELPLRSKVGQGAVYHREGWEYLQAQCSCQDPPPVPLPHLHHPVASERQLRSKVGQGAVYHREGWEYLQAQCSCQDPPPVPLPHLHHPVASERQVTLLSPPGTCEQNMETELPVNLILLLQLKLTAHGDRASTLTHSTWRQSFQLTSPSYCSSNSQHMETELPAQCSCQDPPPVPLPHLHHPVASERQVTLLSPPGPCEQNMETELPVNLILLLQLKLTAHGDRASSTWRQSFQLTSSSYCSSNSQHMETELPGWKFQRWSLAPQNDSFLRQRPLSEETAPELSMKRSSGGSKGGRGLGAGAGAGVGSAPVTTSLAPRMGPLNPSLPRSRSPTNTLITDPLLTYTYDRAVCHMCSITECILGACCTPPSLRCMSCLGGNQSALSNCPSVQSLPSLTAPLYRVCPLLLPLCTESALFNCPSVKSLPSLTAPLYRSALSNCPSVQSLPSLTAPLYRSALSNCPSVQSLPSLTAPLYRSLPSLTAPLYRSLPSLTAPLYRSALSNCPSVQSLPSLTAPVQNLNAGKELLICPSYKQLKHGPLSLTKSICPFVKRHDGSDEMSGEFVALLTAHHALSRFI
ncbi:hypothetical protein JZ751_029608 [Albula glossodonta]|uniref:Uncharacterized protein n=1 Tax=Albula glossodonta TaxID=121402 RepID=A0A8T2N9X4_9TELE|nr:hypothetical protein JZ751_029608 [Albula glossodonta]